MRRPLALGLSAEERRAVIHHPDGDQVSSVVSIEGVLYVDQKCLLLHCQRQVHLTGGDSLSCPVCSSPLIETAESAAPLRALSVDLPSEVFLG